MKGSRQLGELAALVSFVTALVLCLFYAYTTWSGLRDLHQARAEARATLAALQKRAAAMPTAHPVARAGEPPGNPFLDGETVTVAGARLQMRVVSAVTKADGAVTSSQINLQDAKGTEQRVRLTINFEIEAGQLQPLFFDLEAGMPFLYVEDLVIAAPPVGAETERQPMRGTMTVSGFWREAKT